METTTKKLEQLTNLPYTSDVILFIKIASSVLGVLIGLLALNLLYKFSMEAFYAWKRTQNEGSQMIVEVKNADQLTDENTEKPTNTQANEKSIEMQDKINVNELI